MVNGGLNTCYSTMHEPFCGVDANKKEKRKYCNDERRRAASGHKVRKSWDYQKRAIRSLFFFHPFTRVSRCRTPCDTCFTIYTTWFCTFIIFACTCVLGNRSQTGTKVPRPLECPHA